MEKWPIRITQSQYFCSPHLNICHIAAVFKLSPELSVSVFKKSEINWTGGYLDISISYLLFNFRLPTHDYVLHITWRIDWTSVNYTYCVCVPQCSPALWGYV